VVSTLSMCDRLVGYLDTGKDVILSGCVAPPDVSLSEFIDRLNRKLQVLGMKVDVARMEDSHETWYGLVNITPDAAAKEGSKYNAQQLEFFNKIASSYNSSNHNNSNNSIVMIRYRFLV